jgi:energy-coupling factor transporter ATP-binding protein EcfA2
MAALMLKLESVTYRYAGAPRPSLHGVSLELADGEVLGLVGASEAGKTTLCLVASGLAPRTVGGTLTGRVLLDGEEMTPLPMHELAGRVGIAFASPATQLSGVAATVYEEVAFGPMNLGVPRSELIARTEEALASLRIEALADRDPARLSGGQQQLVAIAGLLALRPRHLVLDEPTAQLDVRGESEIFGRILAATRDCTTVLISHRFSTVRQADRICVLEAGRLVELGSHDELMALGGRYRTMFDLQASRFGQSTEVDELGEEVVHDTLD